MKNNLLPQKLRELRKAHGYTQVYVASVLECARQTYANYETGLRKPSSDVLFVLAGLYNISTDDLLQLTIELDRDVYYDAPAPTQSSEDVRDYIEFFNNPTNVKRFRNFSNLERELFYYFQKISEVDKKELVAIAKMKAQKDR